MVNEVKPSNIVSFKKREVVDPDLEKLPGRLEMIKNIIKMNIAILKDAEIYDILMILGPFYFHGNNDPIFKGILNDYMADVLEKLLEVIDSDIFEKSVATSDIPAILNNAEYLMEKKLPVNITFPLDSAVNSVALILVEGKWLITDIFINHKSARQRAFEVAMEKTGKTVDDLFYPTNRVK